MAAQKFTKEDVTRLTKQIKETVEKAKKENKHENFAGLTEEDIARKLHRVNSPMIVGMGWSNSSPGGTESVSFTITNPDPVAVFGLRVAVWVGTGNPDANTGTFLLNVDPRFPRLSQTGSVGFSLASGASTSINFTFTVPASVERTTYMGEACLMRVDFLDIGTYLDRACFPFVVS